MKTKRRLRKWVKVVIVFIIFSAIIINDLETKKQINSCISQGYSENYCMAQLGLI